jgi:DUF1680 family protein
MFLLHGDGKYLDVLERTLYNGFLSGTSLSGNTFFYSNPLESDAVFEFNSDGGVERNPWFECSCCPTNVVRLFPALPGYVTATRGDTLFVGLYVAGEARVAMPEGEVRLVMEGNYPWDGALRFTVDPERPATFTLALRIPGWAQGRPLPGDLYRYLDGASDPIALRVNGEAVPLEIEGGFARIARSWRSGDTVELTLPMPVRRVLAHERVADDRGKVAVERGPLVYCAEGIDNGGRALSLELADDAAWQTERRDDLLGGITTLRGGGVTLVPYYVWAHRGPGEMAVWLRRQGPPADSGGR